MVNPAAMPCRQAAFESSICLALQPDDMHSLLGKGLEHRLAAAMLGSLAGCSEGHCHPALTGADQAAQSCAWNSTWVQVTSLA